jgi:hypothetical protein
MIPLAAPIALAVFAFVAWRYEARSWRAYEATLSEAQKREFRALRRIYPSRWRALVSKNKDFDFQRSPRPEQPDQTAPDQSAKIPHRWDYQPIRERQSAVLGLR